MRVFYSSFLSEMRFTALISSIFPFHSRYSIFERMLWMCRWKMLRFGILGIWSDGLFYDPNGTSLSTGVQLDSSSKRPEYKSVWKVFQSCNCMDGSRWLCNSISIGKETCFSGTWKWTGCRISHWTVNIYTSAPTMQSSISPHKRFPKVVMRREGDDDDDISWLSLGSSFGIGNLILKLHIIQFHPDVDDDVFVKNESKKLWFVCFIQCSPCNGEWLITSGYLTGTQALTNPSPKCHVTTRQGIRHTFLFTWVIKCYSFLQRAEPVEWDAEKESGNKRLQIEKWKRKVLRCEHSWIHAANTSVWWKEAPAISPPPPSRQAAIALWKCFVYIFHALYLFNKSIRNGVAKHRAHVSAVSTSAQPTNVRSMCARRSATTEIKRRMERNICTVVWRTSLSNIPLFLFFSFIFVCSCRSYLFAALSKSVNFLATK